MPANVTNSKQAGILQVGKPAACAGLTVRALHYYDEIGLLKPSARAQSGYRVYDRGDVARLYQIQALRRLGLALPQIAERFSAGVAEANGIIARHLGTLEWQLRKTGELHAHLTRVHRQLEQGEAPPLAAWTAALEMLSASESMPTSPYPG